MRRSATWLRSFARRASKACRSLRRTGPTASSSCRTPSIRMRRRPRRIRWPILRASTSLRSRCFPIRRSAWTRRRAWRKRSTPSTFPKSSRSTQPAAPWCARPIPAKCLKPWRLRKTASRRSLPFAPRRSRPRRCARAQALLRFPGRLQVLMLFARSSKTWCARCRGASI